MTGPSSQPQPAVYRLQARLADDARILVLDDVPHRRLDKWLMPNHPDVLPEGLSAYWSGEPDGRCLEYPSFHVDAPIFTRRSLAVLGADLAAGGRFLPVSVDGVDDEYRLYLVENVVDCLDQNRSSKPRRTTKYIQHAVFRPDRLPSLPAFRVPQSPTVVYWTRPFSERVLEVVGADAEALLVWSQDRSLPVHPNPLRA